MRSIPAELCARCKGYKRLCGLPRCPLLERFRAEIHAYTRVAASRSVVGSTPPSLVVGEHGYPRVRVFYGVPPGVFGEAARKYDDPSGWWGRLGLEEIIRLRAGLVASALSIDARDPWRLYEKELSLAAVSEKPVSSEAELARPPRPRLRFDGILKPVGLTAPARSVEVEENPRIPRPIEKMVWDDAPAAEAVWELYRQGVDYYSIIRALSVGLMGRIKARRLVPTRWAITAVDSIIGEKLRKIVRDSRVLDSVETYYGEYLGNRFAVILLPMEYGAEWIEVWHPSSAWSPGREPVVIRNRENWRGRWSFMDGGYLAARLAVLERLAERRRQAYVVIIREVLPEYYAPVGNWHIRETLRRVLNKPLMRAQSLDEALRELAPRFEANVEELASRLDYRRRRRLSEWM